jgi:prepilin-type N-terminal cleavage/methylation domain-containing protein
MERVGMEITSKESAMNKRENSGFTLIELLIAIVLGLVLMAGVYRTFRTQQDSYIVQDQVAAMQQNLRGAMYLITRDLQMAGWYTNFDRNNHSIDWDSLGTSKNLRPLVISDDNNSTVGDDVNDGTDMLVIVKAANGSSHPLADTETASGTTLSIDLSSSGLNPANNKYGLLVKNDLHTADFFVLTAPSTLAWTLGASYQGNADPTKADMLFRTDIIIYKIDNDAATGRPMLYRRNLGSDNGFQAVAESIENLQVRYELNSGTWVDALTAANQAQVRAVEVFLVGRTASAQRGYIDTGTYNFADNPNPNPGGPYRRKVLSTIVKTRNVGL